MKRQLAAILYADVAGYSRLTGLAEEQTHQKLDAGLNLLTSMMAERFMKRETPFWLSLTVSLLRLTAL